MGNALSELSLEQRMVRFERLKNRKPNRVSMCGDTGSPCNNVRCPSSYVASDWYRDEFGNKTRTIQGGFCLRDLELNRREYEKTRKEA